MAGTSNSITTHNVLSGVLNADNVISGLVNTAFNPAYALVTQAGAQIALFINNNDYKMYAQLKDKSGNVIYTSNIIDLPLETMVVDGRYDSNTKKLILVLDNENEIEVPLEALINGLVNEDDLVANYYDKDEIDALLDGYWTKIELTQEDIDNWNAADAAFESELFDDGVISIEDSTEANINNTMNKSQLKIDLKGNTSQESTTGKNKINIAGGDKSGSTTLNGLTFKINNDGSITISGTSNNSFSFPIDYTTVMPLTLGTNYFYSIKDSQGNDLPTSLFQVEWLGINNNKKYNYGSVNNIDGIKRVRIYGDSGKTINETYYFQIEEGISYTNWEPYTYGASPNPDYPQDIQVVSGDNTIKVEGKNLCNGITQNYFVNQAAARCGYAVGDSGLIIEVDGASDYTISSNTVQTRYRVGCLNKIPVEGGSDTIVYNGSNKDGTDDSVTINTNGYKYLVVNATDLTAIQIEKGSSASEFQPYRSQTYPIYLGVENLFDKDSPNIIPNKYLDTNGDLQNATKSSVSDYIKVLPSTIYSMQPFNLVSQRLCFYDSSKTFLSSVSLASINPNFTTPNNCEYIRTSFITNDIDIWQIEKGSKANHYTEYGTTPIELCKIGDYQDSIRKSTGKNLFDKNSVNIIQNKYLNDSGVETSDNNFSISDYIKVDANTVYSSQPFENKSACICFYNSSKTFLSSKRLTQIQPNFTTPNNCEYIRVSIWMADINIFQIEKGSTALPYEPYGKVWYLNKQIGKIVLDGNTTYVKSSGYSDETWFCGYITPNVENFKSGIIAFNNRFQNGMYSVVSDKECMANNRNQLHIRILASRLNENSSSGLSEWFSTHNVEIYYVLETPTITEITDTTLIEQLDNLEKAYSYDTQTNISQTNDDMPFILDINAIADNVNGLKLENENQEYKTNKVIELSSNSTDDEYPSAKCVYDIVGNIEAVLAAMDSGSGV